MTYTKADLADSLCDELSIGRREAKEIVEALFEEMKISLETGEPVKISAYGNFELRDKNERPGRNPKTGEEVAISARRVVSFRPGQKLKANIETSAKTAEDQEGE